MSVDFVKAYIGAGANLGDAHTTLNAAVHAIGSLPSTQIVAVSPYYRSAPVDASGPDYLNLVMEIQTQLAPLSLLHALQTIEKDYGRQRPYRNAPRTLDLDILLYGDEKIANKELTVPHPRMLGRAFVLKPLHDIASALVSEEALMQVKDQRCEKL